MTEDDDTDRLYITALNPINISIAIGMWLFLIALIVLTMWSV